MHRCFGNFIKVCICSLRINSCVIIKSVFSFIFSSLSPYSFDVSPSAVSELPNLTDVPIGAIPLLTTCSPDFQDAINKTVASANIVYNEFLKTEEGKGFSGQVAIVGDSMGAILAHDALCRVSHTRHGSEASNLDEDVYHGLLTDPDLDATKLLTAPAPRRRSSSTSDSRLPRFEFEVGDFFMFGSPLSIVLAARRLTDSRVGNQKPHCQQGRFKNLRSQGDQNSITIIFFIISVFCSIFLVYNLFHPTDPIASRIEPLLSARFSMLAPVNIPRYAKYPLGNGQPYHLCKLNEIICAPKQF